MKKKHLVLILLCIPFLLNAQFTPNGSDLYHTNGNVGIGTSSPAFQLHMKDPIGGAALGLEKGVEVGEFQMKLLQKVEELTLYIIEHQKEMKFLKRENKIQQAEIKELKKKLKYLTIKK